MAKKSETPVYSPTARKRHEIREDSPWPSPIPMPRLPTEDARYVLKQILVRLDAIEKRLENIEKTLMENQHTR
ncbi:MAG: hypothetical protein OEY30_03530 [Candidatus Bathyarchaeota archaeon]|nr:hypothetical protein [Candidatus Bathyarchaeota archaeon]